MFRSLPVLLPSTLCKALFSDKKGTTFLVCPRSVASDSVDFTSNCRGVEQRSTRTGRTDVRLDNKTNSAHGMRRARAKKSGDVGAREFFKGNFNGEFDGNNDSDYCFGV